jgi:lipopolysaccharide exporter
MFGPATLGLYQIASDIGHLPASEVAAPIRRPMFAGYAQVAGDLGALRRQFIDGFGLVLMIFIPLSVGLAVTADSITPLCLGPKWADAAPFIAVSALWALFDNLGYMANNIYIIRGAQRRFACIRAVIQIVRIVLVIACGLTFGVIGALLALLVTAILACLVWFSGLLPLLDMRWSNLCCVAWRPFVAALAMTAGVRALAAIWPAPQVVWLLALQTSTLCALGALIYVTVQMALWIALERGGGPEQLVIGWLRSRFGDVWRLRVAAGSSS